MSIVKADAIILRNRRFSESSLVATLFSREYGRLDVLAKGARREKSPLFGHLDLYQREEVLVYRRSQAGLDLLTEAAFINEHAGLRFCPPAFAAAGFLADLAAESTLAGDPNPGLFDLLAGSLAVLAELGEPAAKAGLAPDAAFSRQQKSILVGRTLKLAILDMLAWLGFGLELRRCTVCASPAPANRPTYLSRRHGGLVCVNCRAVARDAVTIAPAALASLRERGADAERHELDLAPGERTRWIRFLVDYARHSVEKPLRGRNVLLQLLG